MTGKIADTRRGESADQVMLNANGDKSEHVQESPTTVDIARNLLGATLMRIERNGTRTGGVIIETEAYCGERDRACHAHRGKTARTSTMYGPPNRWYVYMIYGMYHCLNLVTQPEGQPEAVLIRALKPVQGLDLMAKRRKTADERNLCSGPGKLCEALHITRELNGKPSSGSGATLILERQTAPLSSGRILATPRIGVDYAGDDRWKPWRFVITTQTI